MRFPDGFLWGVATSSHQVEGGTRHNQWTAWEEDGRIRDGSCCAAACDWWNRAEDDIDLARQIGLNAIRISVEWSRLEPQEGRWDRNSLARYYKLLLQLRQRGIRPFITLHHFTHPRWFEQRGGFLAKDAVETFSRFVYRTVEALHPLCRDWITVNEPNVFSAFGYLVGEFPPGKQGEVSGTLLALANLARGHAAAYDIIHGFQPQANVGFAQNYVAFAPASPRYRDRLATRLCNQLFNESFFELLDKGRLPAPWDRFGATVSEAKGKFDFVGLNVYSRLRVAIDPRAKATFYTRLNVPDDVPQGDSAAEYPYGECYPEAVVQAALYASHFGRPLYITENGVPDRTDRLRPWLLVHVAKRMHDLLAAGYDLRGYFHWTLVDSFEWSEGWRLRFGLYELDTETQQRRPRPSAAVYSKIVRANGLADELYAEHCGLPEVAPPQPPPGLLAPANGEPATLPRNATIHLDFTKS